MPTTSWNQHAVTWSRFLVDGPAYREVVERDLMPTRTALAKIAAVNDDACVLSTDMESPLIGSTDIQVYGMAWYDRRLATARLRAEADTSGRTWASVVSALGVSHATVVPGKDESLPAGLREIGFRIVDRVSFVQIWAMPDARDRVCRSQVKARRDEARRHFRFVEEQP
jgi:hypothetical protein